MFEGFLDLVKEHHRLKYFIRIFLSSWVVNYFLFILITQFEAIMSRNFIFLKINDRNAIFKVYIWDLDYLDFDLDQINIFPLF